MSATRRPYVLVLMDDHRDWLTTHEQAIHDALPEAPAHVIHLVDTEHRGYTAQMITGWDALNRCTCEHVWFHEADFIPEEPIPLAAMRATLDENPQLAQIALLRQPWFHNEVEHGGLIEALEESGHIFLQRDGFIEHAAGWTGNPCLFRRDITDRYDWPDTDWSEATFGRRLREDGRTFAYYGTRGDAPRVRHVGTRTDQSHGY